MKGATPVMKQPGRRTVNYYGRENQRREARKNKEKMYKFKVRQMFIWIPSHSNLFYFPRTVSRTNIKKILIYCVPLLSTPDERYCKTS